MVGVTGSIPVAPTIQSHFPRVDRVSGAPYEPGQTSTSIRRAAPWKQAMKVRNSLKSLRGRHRDNRLVRRKGRVYVINKTQKRFKARQG